MGVRARVRRGAELLDMIMPRWPELVPPQWLHMGCEGGHVLTHIFGTFWRGATFLESLPQTRGTDAADWGFCLGKELRDQLTPRELVLASSTLNQFWHDELAKRRLRVLDANLN